ncbi:MAG: hypothetical protein AB7Q42_10440 [Acidimicrobiia bacterium]
MESDIKLSDDTVELIGRCTRAQSWDFELNAPDRRTEQPERRRRALVHDQRDGLTINWARDYPAGVAILGPTAMDSLSVHGDVHAREVLSETLTARGVQAAREVRVGESLLIGGHRLAYAHPHPNAGEHLRVGEPEAGTFVVEGRGVQVEGSLHVRQDAYFDSPPRATDVLLHQAAGGVARDRSLLAVIAELEARIAALERR